MRPLLLFAAGILICGCAETTPAPDEAPLALFWRPGELFGLAWLDPASLHPREPIVQIGEYHYTWSYSPDGSQLAVGISAPGATGRVGIRIVDVERMRVVHDVETGIAAEALAWLTPTRLVAVTLQGDALLVEPSSGQILRRTPLPLRLQCVPSPQQTGLTQGELVVLLAESVDVAPQVAALDAMGSVRTAVLTGVRVGSRRTGWCERAGLAVDSTRERAFVIAAGPSLAEVDLRSMAVQHREIAGLVSGPPDATKVRRALWLGDERLAVFGEDLTAGQGLPAGVTLIDTGRGTAQVLQRNASTARLVGSTLLAYGGSLGLRGYSIRGEPTFHLLGSAYVREVEVWGQFAYARTADTVSIVDPASGVLVRNVNGVAPGGFFLLWPPGTSP
jgi:hypothetical protein